MAAIAVRSVAPRDRAAWERLWAGYNAFYERAGPTALPDAVSESTWRRFFDPGEPVHALVAELDGQVVGLAHYLFHRSTTQLADVCYLQDLFTAEAARGRGVGRALIEAVYRRAEEAGAGRVYWQTHEKNAAAIALYQTLAERSGFIVFRHTLSAPRRGVDR
jgi:GNAT superfamily N-acetyltransferase